MSQLNILVYGEGGRETALRESIQKSPLVSEVHSMPASTNFTEVVRFCRLKKIDMAVIGPEAPLVAGIVGELQKAEIIAFGPSKLAAQLEGSKIYMKTRCERWGISTAKFDFAGSYAVAERIIKNRGFRIVKANGLWSGKGVVIAGSEEEALEAAKEWLLKDGKIVIEERLQGVECSFMVLCDGIEFRPLALARDEKRLRADSDIMTGGVRAHSPVLDVTNEQITVMEGMVSTLLSDMRMAGQTYIHKDQVQDCVGIPYQGVLYGGFMLTEEGPKLLEINCRFGDPEAQIVLPRLDTDIVPYLLACTTVGGLVGMPPLAWKKEAAACVVLFSEDYPASGHRLETVTRFGPTVTAAYDKVYDDLREMRTNARYREKDFPAGI
ncbi:MAG: phosphoribosylamine--glycine ligase [bacterium]|nr:phosphoribosylamine--glycine ligase [bacterium]